MCTKNKYRIERADGKVFFAFARKDYDVEEFYTKDELYRKMYKVEKIPCGYCWQCKKKKAKEWAFRGVKEKQYHDKSFMITLTYDDEHLPKTQYIDKQTGELITTSTLKRDDQRQFIKNIRKKLGNNLKILGCGEYGSDKDYVDWRGNKRKGSERPHYHIIIMGNVPKDLKFWTYSKCEWSKQKNKLYRSKSMSDSWGKGHADINEVNKETIEYVCRYTTKKLYGDAGKEVYDKKNRYVPYLVSSKGFGKQYYEDNKDKFWNEEKHFLLTKKGVEEIDHPGRYFDKLMKAEDEELFEKLKAGRTKKAEEYWNDLISKTDLTKIEYIENLDQKENAKARRMKRTLR